MTAARAHRTPLICGNWKMNLDHLQATHFVQKLDWTLRDAKHDYDAVEVAILPPFTDLRSVQTLVEADKMKMTYGAQDLSRHTLGPFTGQISGAFLAKLGCTYVVCGHSERREHQHETDEVVNHKVLSAFHHGLTPILCIGEGLSVRREGGAVPFVVEQLRAALLDVNPENLSDIVIAYEPVWAIGTGEVATPEDAQQVCEAIRHFVADISSGATADQTRIIYGGSVKSKSIASLMAQDDVDGALVGGASIDPEEFAAICRFREHVTA
ncbi:triose-phosphate isomerase [Lapillicoccus sp.]|uniref:triose-phosphate isomerase n=1 Tax=Lapillicoccus sp. TaxID=1909287 RepID=UPI00326487B6